MRFLENNNLLYSNHRNLTKDAGLRQTLDHQGLDFEKLIEANVRQFSMIEQEIDKMAEALRKSPLTL